MGKIVECELCPKRCKLEHLQRGDCRVRFNKDGKLMTLVYSRPCSVHIDPVEKKPMYHFLPGTEAFSISTAGCNLHCKFCQNWSISQTNPEDTKNYDLSPEAVVVNTIKTRCNSIAYTYAEPIVYFEYMYDTAIIARKRQIKNIMVSAGYINEEPLKMLCEYIDGANMGLKGFTEDYYRNVCFARLKPILNTLKIMVAMGVFIEITNLIVPTLNDDMKKIGEMCKWIRENLGEDIPLHFSRFYPQYKLKNLYPTPIETLINAREIAMEIGLHYVYVGNVPGEKGEDTICPQCKNIVINRTGYSILGYYINNNGKCMSCGYKINGVWT